MHLEYAERTIHARFLFAVLLCTLSVRALACTEELTGIYALQAADGGHAEVLKLEAKANRFVAFIKGNSGWDSNPQDTQPYPAEQFAALTRLPAPSDYCGVVVSGVIVARVPRGWEWAGLAVQSGYVLVSLGGPREAYRIPR